jgi:hypothetical protein
VGLRYMDLNFAGEDGAHQREDSESDRFGDGRGEIVEAWFEDDDDRRAAALPGGRRCSFVARARFDETVEDPILGFALQNSEHQTVVAASTLTLNPRLGSFRAGEEVTFRISFDNVLRPDRYYATPAIAHAGTGFAWIDRRERFAEVVVTGTSKTDAILDLPCDVRLDRGAVERPPSGVAG